MASFKHKLINNGSTSVVENCSSAAIKERVEAGRKIPNGYYYLAEPIILDRPTVVDLPIGFASSLTHNTIKQERNDRCVFYTDQDIDFFVIKSNNVYIRGGVFDYSNAADYRGAIFRYIVPYKKTPPWTETRGAYGGGCTDFWILGNQKTLSQKGNGAACILLDWEQSDDHAFLYLHKWRGRADYVNCGFEETRLNQGKTGQNTTWNDIDLTLWGAKQAFIVHGQNRSNFRLRFQPQWGLHESEKDLPVMEFHSGGNDVDPQFVDMQIPLHPDFGYSNSKTVKTVAGNRFNTEHPSDKYLLETYAIETGQRLNLRTVADDAYSQLNNQLFGFKGDTVFRSYPTTSISLSPSSPSSLLKAGGFRPVLSWQEGADLEIDYFEFWFKIGNALRLTKFEATIDGPNSIRSGIMKYQVVQKNDQGNVMLDKIFELPETIGAFASLRELQCNLNSTNYTDVFIVRFFGSYAEKASYQILNFAIFDDRRQLLPY